jgi:hypothetical protein
MNLDHPSLYASGSHYSEIIDALPTFLHVFGSEYGG